METHKQPRNIVAVLATIVFTVVFGTGIYLLSRSPYSYGQPEMAYQLWWVQILLIVVTLGFIFKYFTWKSVGFGKIDIKHLLWILPTTVYTLLKLPVVFEFISMNLGLSMLVLFVTLCVSLGEELMFRGFVLRVFLKNMTPRKAILYSAILFSLIHAVNIISTGSVTALVGQLLYTFLFGLFAAGVALATKSIWPIMISHWLNNYVNIAAGVVGGTTALLTVLNYVGLAFTLIASIIFLVKANTWWQKDASSDGATENT